MKEREAMSILRKSNLIAAMLMCTPAVASADGIGPFVNGVPAANPAQGSPANVISSDFTATLVVTGSDPLENSSGGITQFGNLETGPSTNPDQNLYLEFDTRITGPTAGYDYGHHF